PIQRAIKQHAQISKKPSDNYPRVFLRAPFVFREKRPAQKQVIIEVQDQQINSFTQFICQFQLKFIHEQKYSLEQYFKSLY
ncbi:hypothetical protein, partial [Enterococcus nangangensis]|uniref:hypothetical protein n=1 Tax=Enterococcus nangangensis TaxID=2559926 RepID=UPI0035309CBF